MKDTFIMREEKLIKLMCLAPGMTPLYPFVIEYMNEENIPRI